MPRSSEQTSPRVYAAATGARVVYYPKASIVHYGARSSANAGVKPFSLLKAREGDTVVLRSPSGEEQLQIMEVNYQ